ncbi:MAG: M64 family metallopeptidase, partial [Prevotellaceae bacterium]|nr:M64 family metallopeptidase [Prevotellaceae bacterium]
GDYGNGVSVSYFPVGSDATALEQVLHHEANGHGFSKLADEYSYEYMGEISATEIANNKQLETFGWWKNVDYTSDPSTIKWSHFLADERYAYDGLGAYEGGLTYWTGVWRPTDNSIMRYNTGGFNAPSREAIYYRIHKLAFGESWTYNYEEFVAYDAINRRTSTSSGAFRIDIPKNYKPLHPPVVKKMSWRDAMQKK